jgi:precorrin-6Y C5,15-methyltransferase (decarboxylating)
LKEILIFAGTTEGRRLSEVLSEAEVSHTLCVATEYGEFVLKEQPFRTIHKGRMELEEMQEFIRQGNFLAVVDATHPYAAVVTKNIKEALENIASSEGEAPCYFRLQRKGATFHAKEGVRTFSTPEECGKALEEIEGNILLTTGSKELSKYCVSETVKERLFVRVLPSVESISLCEAQGLKGRQIIAMQGPFTIEMNEAIIRQYGISCMVSKESGAAGGYGEKMEAAKNTGILSLTIARPEEEGYSFSQLVQKLSKLLGKTLQMSPALFITLAGIGMGDKNNITKEVAAKIKEADILLGAERMLTPFTPHIEKKPLYLAKEIIPYLKELKKRELSLDRLKVVVLFSGDSGFYSGCQSVYRSLEEEMKAGYLRGEVKILPGISSISYLAARLGESYHNARILSIHGKELKNLAKRIQKEEKTYLLFSGVKEVNRLGQLLLEAGMTDCEVFVGFRLSYPEEKITRLSPKDWVDFTEEGLYTCLIKNPFPRKPLLTPSRGDGEFLREKVPMTKEEVREVGICKMKLYEGAVVYDVGSGTGSIAIEIASLSNDIQVYAIEQKKEAVSLIGKNKEKFALENIELVEAKAPEGLEQLPKPTHAFIGGSSGGLKEILSVLYEKNPQMRVVMTAISLETIAEFKEVLSQYSIENEELVQIQVSRTRKAGRYHLMQAENPVWLCSFDFSAAGDRS